MGSEAGALGADSLGFVISDCIYVETIRISVKELKFKIMLEWSSVHRAIIISYIRDNKMKDDNLNHSHDYEHFPSQFPGIHLLISMYSCSTRAQDPPECSSFCFFSDISMDSSGL